MAAAALICTYALLLVNNGLLADTEQFPVFKWSLFSKVPKRVETSYGIRLLEVSGRRLSPPLYFEDTRGMGFRTNSPNASVLTQSIGAATTPGREAVLAERLALFESRFLAGHGPVRYQLVRREYDPIERFSCKCYLSEEVVGEFRTG